MLEISAPVDCGKFLARAGTGVTKCVPSTTAEIKSCRRSVNTGEGKAPCCLVLSNPLLLFIVKVNPSVVSNTASIGSTKLYTSAVLILEVQVLALEQIRCSIRVDCATKEGIVHTSQKAKQLLWRLSLVADGMMKVNRSGEEVRIQQENIR